MRYFEDLVIGEERESNPVKVTAREIIEFATKFDPQPFHIDEEAAKKTMFGGLIGSGTHTLAYWRKVVEDDKLIERAMEIANTLTVGSFSANYAVKKLLLHSFNNSLETQMKIEGREISMCADSNDGREGITAFIAKRKPVFE